MAAISRGSSSTLDADVQNFDIVQMMKEDLAHIIKSVEDPEAKKVLVCARKVFV